ncbi:hypothetical protein OsI_37732 [Oryza sativa Indica Group]|uniref:Uncharacterized protein n=1 Tax=Oryza sativa subsp. indica TaxID=39946 RepID=B8BNJ0_ORYSI|nr:hypothetical protein OsI_37732 [Oryza sativa Indica Group]
MRISEPADTSRHRRPQAAVHLKMPPPQAAVPEPDTCSRTSGSRSTSRRSTRRRRAERRQEQVQGLRPRRPPDRPPLI